MAGVSVVINQKDVDALTKKFKSIGKQGIKEFTDITFSNAHELEEMAKSLATTNKKTTGGDLRQGIRTIQAGKMTWRVVANMPYSAYIEFGTGTNVDVPAEWRTMAMKFKGAGIRQVNIRPQPFMYPAYRRIGPKYVKELEEKLEQLIK